MSKGCVSLLLPFNCHSFSSNCCDLTQLKFWLIRAGVFIREVLQRLPQPGTLGMTSKKYHSVINNNIPLVQTVFLEKEEARDVLLLILFVVNKPFLLAGLNTAEQTR